MAQRYISMKVTLSPLEGNLYRSRVDWSSRGASRGPGYNFALTGEVEDKVRDFVRRMPGGGFKREEVQTLGQMLFDLVFRGEVLTKYKECLTLAEESGARLRIVLAVLAEDLLFVPWEYFHDRGSFLLKSNQEVVRTIDELPIRPIPFRMIQRLLVAVANPKDDNYPSFDAEAHIARLNAIFNQVKGLKVETLPSATRDLLEKRILDCSYDALYFVGHGRFIPNGEGQLILEKDDHSADGLDADNLAVLLRSPKDNGRKVQFVYLNSCSTAKTGTGNPFAGVAQRLMRDAEVIAVVAMQTDIAQDAALKISQGFFEELRRGKNPEEAMLLARNKVGGDDQSWGIPVIYGSPSGHDKFDQSRIACLLSAEQGKSKYILLLPTFKMGILTAEKRDVKVTIDPPDAYHYRNETFAARDIEAAEAVLRLLGRVAGLSDISLGPNTEHDKAEQSHRFLFGSKSNEQVKAISSAFSEEFRFYFGDHAKFPGEWVLEDLKHDKVYHTPDPSTLDEDAYKAGEDFGVIQKIVLPERRRVYFLFSGLGDRATHGCALYFLEKWEELLAEYGSDEFAVILSFPRGLGPNEGMRLNRGKSGN